MQTDQSASERSDKSHGSGRSTPQSDRLDDASQSHGTGWVDSGFDLPSLVSEYHALRASVVRLWRESQPYRNAHELDDLTRFHESIDQSLARAVLAYTRRVDRSRRTFLAILDHDLLGPLSAIRMAAAVLRRKKQLDDDSAEMASVVDTCAHEMAGTVGNLLDFATGLGGQMPVTPAPTDLGQICHDVTAEVRTAHPGCTIDLQTLGDLAGRWDAGRLRQGIANLVGNAIQHGGDACRADVTATADGLEAVTVAIHNGGSPIPPDLLPTIFEPMVRDTSRKSAPHRRGGSIGLGLYIARSIVTAHGGTVDVTSSAAAGTTFTVRVPRRPPGR